MAVFEDPENGIHGEGRYMALGFLRRHKRWLYVFLWVVILGFIAFYIPMFQGADAGTAGETVARVGGLPIRTSEFQRAYFQQRQRFEQMYQGRMDPAMLRRLGLEDQVLEALVAEKLVVLEARRLGLSVDDETLAREISKIPGLQEKGRFVGAVEYRRRLEMQGRSIEEFEEAMRAQLLREKLEALVSDGVSVSPTEAEQEYRRRNEQVKAEYVLVDAARYQPEATVADDEVRARFEAGKDSYRVPEKRVLSYLLLDMEALQSRITVTDRDIEAYYQEHRDEYRDDEQACASHILVKVKEAPEATEGHSDDEAKRIAQGLLGQVRAGADFAALAKKASEDKGSAARGGDLGCFPRGQMVPEFENATFSMKPGETSDLVKSPFGYHIIHLASHRDESAKPMALVKEPIRRILLGERAQAALEEKAQAIAAALRRGKSLDEAGKPHGLAPQKSAPLARGEPADPLRSPSLVSKAFELKAGDVDKEGFAVPRGYAFIALAEIKPSHVPELKEVQAKIKADLAEEKALARARAVAEELKSRAEKVGLEEAAAAVGLVRKETPDHVGRGNSLGDLGTGVSLEEVAYALPEKTLSDPVRAGSGWAILRILEKKSFDPVAFEKEKASLASSLRDERRGQLFQAYMGQARQRFTVERNAEAFRRVASR
jgi:peptidyl-prolyl cis-trans isomerase D